MLNENTVQRQYDEIIASNYDKDPQNILTSCLERAMVQFEAANLLQADTSLRTLDICLGTGTFLTNLMVRSQGTIEPFGLDFSEEMVNIARSKIPNLKVVVDSANNLENHFTDQSFDLICSHHMIGFVPMAELAPKVWDKLDVGGYWSLIGQSLACYPRLNKEMESMKFKLYCWLSGAGKFEVSKMACNPANHNEVLKIFEENGFEICSAETFEPNVNFANLEEFLEFGYSGGWLTHFIEVAGVQNASKLATAIVNSVFFPFTDNLSFELALVRKIG